MAKEFMLLPGNPYKCPDVVYNKLKQLQSSFPNNRIGNIPNFIAKYAYDHTPDGTTILTYCKAHPNALIRTKVQNIGGCNIPHDCYFGWNSRIEQLTTVNIYHLDENTNYLMDIVDNTEIINTVNAPIKLKLPWTKHIWENVWATTHCISRLTI